MTHPRTPLERVRRARSRLVAATVAAAALWGTAAGALILALGQLAGRTGVFGARAVAAAPSVAAAAAAVALGVCALLLWRGRAAWSVPRVALWIEERAPELRYALVTATDPTLPPMDADSPLARAAGAAGMEGIVSRAAWRATGRATAGCLAAVAAALLLSPAVGLPGVGTLFTSGPATAADAPLANRLERITADVVPPAYSRLPTRRLDDPSNVHALIGSSVVVNGQGPADGVTMIDGADTVAAVAAVDEEGRWALRLTMPPSPVALRLRDRQYERLITLEPRTDSAPTLTLRLPANDTTYRTPPTGRLALEAAAADDIGLAHGYFDFLLTSGEEESFDTKTVEGARMTFGGARGAAMRATIDLDTMKLGPGSVLHIRAVAVDANDVTGPGRGFSETRTLRVASSQEYDTVSVNAADPRPIDTLYMSQRVLNMRTDTLVLRKRSMETAEFEKLSRQYGVKQQEIRARVDRVVAILEDDGVGGRSRTAQSELLREAAGLMWEAYSLLAVDEPEGALPSMRRALALLDEARTAQRYHMRGLLRPNIVNIERVRMQGEDSAAATTREARQRLFDARLLLARRLDAAARLAATAPGAAADSLLVLRLSALQAASGAAPVLQLAAEALRAGTDAAPHLLRARRLLAPATRAVTGAAEWGGAGGDATNGTGSTGGTP